MSHNLNNEIVADHGKTRIKVPIGQFINEICKFIGEGRNVEIVCRGNSMNPFLAHNRDSMVLSPFRREELRKGDVVLAKCSKDYWVIHRIVSTEPLRLNGDGNALSVIEDIPEGQVVARMSGYVRKGKRGTTDSLQWRMYSSIWSVCGKLAAGNWSLRRIILGFWHRAHRSLIYVRPVSENK